MKKVLAIHYSQSGQLSKIISIFTNGIENAIIEHVQVHPKKAFPFPWSTSVFFDTMPETVLENEIALGEFLCKEKQYDLIVLGYQPWFLSPSLPTTALLKNKGFKQILKNTPVITIIGSRNMWLNAQESVKQYLHKAEAKLVGNVPLIDRHSNLISVVTILHWMLKGKKTKKWGIFPKPGISDEDIQSVQQFGELASAHLAESNWGNYQKEVVKKDGVTLSTNILFIEGRAKKIFRIWANIIQKKEKNNGNRKFWVGFFKYYLMFALFIVSPILLLIYNIFVLPFSVKKVNAKKAYFSGVKLKNK